MEHVTAFTRGKYEVTTTMNRGSPEVHQVDAANPDEALHVVAEGDEGYGEIKKVRSVRKVE